jgi:hypothetical protein
MSVSAIASNFLNLPSALQSAQSNGINFADLSAQALAGTQSSNITGSTSSPTTLPFVTSPSPQALLTSELGSLGAQLQAGNLASAKQAYSAFAKDFNGTQPESRHYLHVHGHPKAIYSADAQAVNANNSNASQSSALPLVL